MLAAERDACRVNLREARIAKQGAAAVGLRTLQFEGPDALAQLRALVE